ncbi:MAG: hypothetical protein CL834_02495 [Crocinitomicaceae bacterium]|mgnify:CR=1 FL=1|jgi:hypothetical protein|nr:hypothetical protein [Crocinitomicaceae bacterium]|tara:strand:+ start:4290 stop:5312 length:1023 start_codon:yes stop_codon:yes gene_type:complete
MRWTNYFIHPGDNRYYVFSFREDDHADDFEQRLKNAQIPFERHRENSEWLFGVARTYFKQALNANHLVYAQYRTKFIPVKGLRNAMLAVTLGAVVLALIGFFSSAANAQRIKADNPWSLSIGGLYMVPLEAVGFEAVAASDEGLSILWNPKGGNGFGARIRRNINDQWSVEIGLETLRMIADWELNYNSDWEVNESGDSFLYDTLRLRSSRYRMPLLGIVRVPINAKTELSAGTGISFDFLLSDVFTADYQQNATIYSEYSVEENRQQRLSVPLRADVGLKIKGKTSDDASFYAGFTYWREWNSNRWGEAQWKQGLLDQSKVRIFLPQSAFAVELRIYLP